MQVTSVPAWIEGSGHIRGESRAGAGTSRGSQQGFFPGMLQLSGKLWQKSYSLVCSNREGNAHEKGKFSQLLERIPKEQKHGRLGF